ncbi:penicillin-binding protein 2 [Candidatus Peregrinibacteria bacterium]|nr:penicillin-binding protein 2 [Candidatus Peregrinibacteria bacterium]
MGIFFGQRRYQPPTRDLSRHSRIFVLGALCSFAFIVVIVRLFYLQVIYYDTYNTLAKEQHYGAITLPARRGEILLRDYHSEAISRLATNTTLDLVYVDPFVAEDKVNIARKLAPLLFTEKDYEACKIKQEECRYKITKDPKSVEIIPVPDTAATAPAIEELYSYQEMVDFAAADILKKISKLEVDFVLLEQPASPELMAKVTNERLPGISVDAEKFQIFGNPTLIPESRLADISKTLSKFLDIPIATLEKSLTRRKTRYVPLKNRLDPEISNEINALDLKGIVLVPEHWRFYPEGSLASNLVGFLSREGIGQYGIEGYFNNELEGKKGEIYAESDPFGRQITVGGESKIVQAIDGDSITLTIDRIVQKKVEEILAEATEKFHADSGQAIIIDPFTGALIAMTNAPSFNPNTFAEAFKMRPLKSGELVYKTTKIFKKNEKGEYIKIDPADIDNPKIDKYVYENRTGAEAYKNKAISDTYEPGSAFKPITMAIGIDAKEVEPTTSYDDSGSLKIDTFEIKNALDQYNGKGTTMLDVLAKSLNTGTSFVAKKLGKELFYKYLKDFGFGDYTHIELEGEVKGKVDFWKQWSKAQLLTTSFGQGIAVTPLQLITAWSVLANGGKLVQPHIIDSVKHGEKVVRTTPQIIRRVISEESSSIITSMLVNAVNSGVGRPAYIPEQLIAGKTGTSQIAGPNGRYEPFGDGAFITSFVGYFPALNPRFVILVKFDRPRIGENTWGSTTAAPTFKKIAEFLIEYYSIPSSR